MRTKTLLIAAAALAATVISSEAQVYSANVVGYVNLSTTAGQYALVNNPLDNGTNTLNSLVPSAPTGAQIQIWNGTGYQASTKTPATWNPNFTVLPGQGFFIRTASNFTNTFVGSVVAPVGGSVTNGFQAGIQSLVGSPIPYGDTLNGTNLNLQLPTGSQVQIWNGTGYQASTKTPAGWNPNFSISTGQGFFVRTAVSTNWVQTLYP